VQERYQRAQVRDLGSKWKLFYWDYTRTPRQRRSKSWAKSRVPRNREAQRLADQFMERVNERNNQPDLFASDEDSLQIVYNNCRELTWPHLKNSTRKQYEENFKTYLLPEFGQQQSAEDEDHGTAGLFQHTVASAFAEIGSAHSRYSSCGTEPG
jgi:hypothetical protein